MAGSNPDLIDPDSVRWIELLYFILFAKRDLSNAKDDKENLQIFADEATVVHFFLEFCIFSNAENELYDLDLAAWTIGPYRKYLDQLFIECARLAQGDQAHASKRLSSCADSFFTRCPPVEHWLAGASNLLRDLS